MLFGDIPQAAAAQRSSPVAKAKVSPAARRKAINKRTEDGEPVHSLRTLLKDLASPTRNSVRFGDASPTTILSRPTSISSHSRSPRRQNSIPLSSPINKLRSLSPKVRTNPRVLGLIDHKSRQAGYGGDQRFEAKACPFVGASGAKIVDCRIDCDKRRPSAQRRSASRLRYAFPWPRPIIDGGPMKLSIARDPRGKCMRCACGQA